MKEESSHFAGVDGLQLYKKTWYPDGPAKAILVIVHGAGEHIDRYPTMVDRLVPDGFMLTGYDHRGHGRSEGQRGHINSWDEYRQDLHRFIAQSRELAPGLPLFIYGHSLGSLIVLDYILHYPDGLQGAIISGNSVDPQDAAPPFLVMVAKVFSRFIPGFNLKVELEGTSLSRDPEVAVGYMNDPLVHWNRTARWGTECLREVEWIKARPPEVCIPTLFVHGELDPLVSAQGAKAFFDQIQHPDKTMKIYPGGLHEPHNDIVYTEVVSDIREWLNAHL